MPIYDRASGQEYVKHVLENTGAKNKQYDTDLDGYIDKSTTLGRSLIAGDETEVSTTSTTGETVKTLRLAKLSTVGNNWNNMIVLAECYNDTVGQTMYLDISINGTVVATLTYTKNTYTLKGITIDISSLADGVHTIEIILRVSGGTGYNRLLEVWVE